mmetsp:Transcript_164382/g.522678  ORF Transcript_164382/g.522678 Transcript_164382/m.522678 type:complete len:348 (-) Transcript_164382:233-1276(-)
MFGPKNSLAIGQLLYALYLGGFAVALIAPSAKTVSWMAASVFGGTAGGLFWTAQGGYFAAAASLLSTSTGRPREETTASLAGTFSVVFLLFEVLSKLAFSGLQTTLAPGTIALLFYLLSLLALLAMCWVQELAAPQQATSVYDRLVGTLSLCADPVVWLLSPTNLTFGFCTALMNGHVNATYASVELGSGSVAVLGAVTSGIAAVVAFTLSRLPGSFGKAPLITFGAFCFFSIPFCMLVLHCCNSWGRSLVVLYIFQGMGRAVFESTNRAVFADFFRSAQVESAFANASVQVNFAFALSFFLQTVLTEYWSSIIVASLAISTPLCYVGASALRGGWQRHKQNDDFQA